MTCKGMVERSRTLRQCARGAGLVALVFSLTVATLLAADAYRAGPEATVRSEALARALAQGRAAPGDGQDAAFARELDRLARRAYFNSLAFRRQGMALLVLGLAVTAGCFGVAWRLGLGIPDPRALDGGDPARSDRWTVNAVLAAGAALLAAAAAAQFRHAAPSPADRALRASLANPALKPGEVNVCPCRKGTPRAALAEQWPFLRGPDMSGRSALTGLPAAWNGETGERVRWKTPLARGDAVFATGDLAALDRDGKIVWQRFLGRPKNTYGHASSLVYCGEMLIVQWDQEEDGRVLALDKTTGRTLWETPREAGMSWSTPAVMPLGDAFVLLVHASKQTWGMELATGRKLWQTEAVDGEVAPSLTWEGDVWLAANCYSRMAAFRLPPQGAPSLLWQWDEGNLPDVASPVIADGLVYLATDAGEVLCHDLADGKQLWRKEFADGFYASPVVADGKVYVVDRMKGVFRVYAAGREGRELSANPMGDAVSATPAFAGGCIYVRGHKNLWCIAP